MKMFYLNDEFSSSVVEDTVMEFIVIGVNKLNGPVDMFFGAAEDDQVDDKEESMEDQVKKKYEDRGCADPTAALHNPAEE